MPHICTTSKIACTTAREPVAINNLLCQFGVVEFQAADNVGCSVCVLHIKGRITGAHRTRILECIILLSLETQYLLM